MTESSSFTVAEYSRRLRGEAGGRWLSANGLLAQTNRLYEAGFSAVVTPRLGVAHSIHSALETTTLPGTYGEGLVILLVTRGVMNVRCGDESFTVGEGDVLVSDTMTRMVKDNRDTAEHWTWTLSSSGLGLPGFPEPHVIHRGGRDPLMVALTKVTSGLFSVRPPGKSAALGRFERTLEMIGSLWAEYNLAPEMSPVAEIGVVARIRHVVEGSFRDPNFDVPALAKAVGMSERHVRRVLEAEGMRPSEVIRRARVEGVLRDLEAWGGQATDAWLARRNGFTTARSMKAALEWFEASRFPTQPLALARASNDDPEPGLSRAG